MVPLVLQKETGFATCLCTSFVESCSSHLRRPWRLAAPQPEGDPDVGEGDDGQGDKVLNRHKGDPETSVQRFPFRRWVSKKRPVPSLFRRRKIMGKCLWTLDVIFLAFSEHSLASLFLAHVTGNAFSRVTLSFLGRGAKDLYFSAP